MCWGRVDKSQRCGRLRGSLCRLLATNNITTLVRLQVTNTLRTNRKGKNRFPSTLWYPSLSIPLPLPYGLSFLSFSLLVYWIEMVFLLELSEASKTIISSPFLSDPAGAIQQSTRTVPSAAEIPGKPKTCNRHLSYLSHTTQPM